MIAVLLVLFPSFVTTTLFTYTTIPDTDSGPGYVFANEGTENVPIYCEVFNDVGNQIITRWSIMRQTDSSLLPVTFFVNGTVDTPEYLMGKIEAIGEPFPGFPITYQNNFTIVNFTSEFDGSQIACGQTGALRTFNIGLSGNY